MLALQALTLSHFRSHKYAHIECDNRPIAIFGPNGAGKTNILEAVSLFSPGRGLRRASAADMGRRPESIGWKLTGRLKSLHQTHEIEISCPNGNSRQVRIDDKQAPQLALGRIARVLWLVPSMDRLWIESAEGRRRFLDRITMSFTPSHAEATLAYDKAIRERNRLLKDMVRDAHWYNVLERQLADTGTTIHKNRLAALAQLDIAQHQSETAFPSVHLELLSGDFDFPQNADAYYKALGDSRARDMSAGRTLIGPHRTDLLGTYTAKNIPAKSCSTGEQKALLISLILANARGLARDFGAPPLLLLDEVAAHLDRDRRAALYREITSLGSQVWMTGTGIELFDALGSDAQYIEVTEADGISKTEQLS